MINKTRYFVIASLLVLTVGLGTGLLAYYVGAPTSALGRQGGPDGLITLLFQPHSAGSPVLSWLRHLYRKFAY